MNQQTPLRTPPKPRAEAVASVDNRPLVRFLTMILVVSLVMLTLALVLGFVALSMRNRNESGDPNQPPTQNNQAAESGKPDLTGRGSVVTVPSRSDYGIPNGDDYRTISGISTKHAILVDLNSYGAIAGKDADARICPASMTKIMTVLVVAEQLESLDDRLTFTADVINDSLSSGGSGLKALWTQDNEFSVEDLLYLAFMQSDTAACKTLANYIAGSESAFALLMNDKAREIGMDDTLFSNSTGLVVKGQTYYSTCRDIAMLMAYALENPLASRVLTATEWYMRKDAPISERIMIKPTWQTERLGNATLETVTVKGGKTGYETEPGSCLVTYAKSNGGNGEYILVTIGGNGVSVTQSVRDVKKIYNTYAD